jgi:monothiol glutaredoxin
MNTIEMIKQQIANYPVLLYMKGTVQFPMCGFSARVANILAKHNTSYAYVNILENPDIRVELPKYAQWPTFPQLYVQGQLIGGCDILLEMENNAELKPLLDKAGAIYECPGKVIAAVC